MNGEGTKRERKKRRELGGAHAGYVICSSELLFRPSPVYFLCATFYKAKTRHSPAGILGEGRRRKGRTDCWLFPEVPSTVSRYSFHRFGLPTAGTFCSGCPRQHWARQLPAKKLTSCLTAFPFSILFFIHKHTQVGIERAFVPLHNKRNMTRVKGFLFL